MRREEVKIKILEGGHIPTKGSEKSTCYDLYARKIETVHPWLVKVHLGVHLEPPHGYGVKLYARSNIGKKPWFLSNCLGVGDEDYRGEYIAYFSSISDSTIFEVSTYLTEFINTNHELVLANEVGINPEKLKKNREIFPFPYKVGDRVAQFEIQERTEIDFIVVDELSDTSRGSGGFGSTGK